MEADDIYTIVDFNQPSLTTQKDSTVMEKAVEEIETYLIQLNPLSQNPEC